MNVFPQIVLKFGGSSVANATNMSRVLDIVSAASRKGRVVLVSSAISGCTDALIEIGRTADRECRHRLIDKLQKQHRTIIRRLFTGSEMSKIITDTDKVFAQLEEAEGEVAETFGELLSTMILAWKLECEGIPSFWADSRQLIVKRNGSVDKEESYRRIRELLGSHPETRVFVAPGFIAGDENGAPVTLGRGGSDYSAALYAAAIEAETLEIWTDVPGIMTTNPKDVPAARTVTNISYGAAFDMASHGAKVLYAPAVEPAMEAGIAFSIKNTFDPGNPGTLVGAGTESKVECWKGVSLVGKVRDGISAICLTGENVSNARGAEQRILSALKELGIRPVGSITRTEYGSFLTEVRDIVAKDALAAIHREFFEDSTPAVIDVFIAGHGAVGRALIDMIGRNTDRMARRRGRIIRIVGLSDSHKYVIDLQGIDPAESGYRLQHGESADGGAFFDAVREAAQDKSVLVDCTDDPRIYLRYAELFRKGVNIVTSNRRSVAIPFPEYAALKATAQENGAFFRYDTTVGAAMPILEALSGEANCSDAMVSIEAAVSCTLNYIITSYDGERTESMSTLLKRAQDNGLTESDPRADIGGQDALRKLLILAREAGVALEAEDVEISPMLPEDFFGCDIEEFYRKLDAYEQVFRDKEDELDRINMRQRFVASIRKDSSARLGYKAEIKMQLVSADSPYFFLQGSENVTVIQSELSAPLVIKGAGEGAGLAASGIIKDILM